MSSTHASLSAACTYAHTLDPRGSSVVAMSLTARTAVRVAGEDALVRRLVTTVGVVHLQATLAAALGRDYAPVPPEDLPAVVHLDRHEVRCPPFWVDAHERGWFSRDGTAAEVGRVQAEITAVLGRRDDWVDVDDVLAVLGPRLGRGATVEVVDKVAHNFAVSLAEARSLLRRVTAAALGIPPEDVVEPAFGAMSDFAIQERRRHRRQCEDRWPELTVP